MPTTKPWPEARGAVAGRVRRSGVQRSVTWDIHFRRRLADRASGQRRRRHGVVLPGQLRARERVGLVVAAREADRVREHLLLRRAAVALGVGRANARNEAGVLRRRDADMDRRDSDSKFRRQQVSKRITRSSAWGARGPTIARSLARSLVRLAAPQAGH